MNRLSDQVLSDFSKFIEDRLGLFFPPEKWHDLERGIVAIADQHQFSDLNACIDWLKNNILKKTQNEILASYFTIGETYFFREKGCFEALEKVILPKLIENKRDSGTKTLRIWSAACSSGEEPYSIAILLTKLIPDISSWNITLLASDINLNSQKKLKAGKYTEWSFRETPKEIKEQYFKKTIENRISYYHLLPQIKKMVTPIYLNLVEDSYPSIINNTNAMDLIFCRNVLMYFVPKEAHRVLEKLHESLIKGGFLIVSASEYSQVPTPLFKMENLKNTIVYQKPDAFEVKEVEPELESRNIQTLLPDFPLPPTQETKKVVEPPKKLEKHKLTSKLSQQKTDPTANNKTDNKIDNALSSLEQKAKLLANQGELEEALHTLEKAISMDKFKPHFRYLRALILQELGRNPEAISDFNKAIYLDKDFILSYFSLGMMAYQQEKKLEAKKYFLIVLRLIKKLNPDTIVEGSEDLTVKRLNEIIYSSTVFDHEQERQER